MKSNEDSLKYIINAIEAAGYEPGRQIGICLDVASSEFYNKETGKYHFDGEDRDSAYMLDFYEKLVDEYPIVSIEDPFQEEGWEDWAAITQRLGGRLQFVGDDLLVTNPKRLQKGIDMGAANSLLVKLNQIGTVTETLDAIELATRNGFTSMVSHRSGETPDTTISDLAVAKNTGQIKTGAPAAVSVSQSTTAFLRLKRSSVLQHSTQGTVLSKPAGNMPTEDCRLAALRLPTEGS